MPRGRYLHHAQVVERGLLGVEIRIGPERMKRSRALRVFIPSGRQIDGILHGENLPIVSALAAARPDDVVDLFVRPALRIDPSFHDLHAVEVGAIGFFHGVHQEVRCFALGPLAENASHGMPEGVAGHHHARLCGLLLFKTPTSEKAHAHAGAGRRVDFPSLEGIEDRRPCVFLGPHASETLGARVVVIEASRLTRVVCIGPGWRGAPKARLVGGREPGVRPARADHSELEWVCANRLLDLEPAQERRPSVRAFGGLGICAS